PASYDVRDAGSPISWGSAQSVTRGTCATPVVGTTVGVKHTCTVSGLSQATSYDFELVAFRGTLNVNAVCGGLSNVAKGRTRAGGRHDPHPRRRRPPAVPPRVPPRGRPPAQRTRRRPAVPHRRPHRVGPIRAARVAPDRHDDLPPPGCVAPHRSLLSVGAHAG